MRKENGKGARTGRELKALEQIHRRAEALDNAVREQIVQLYRDGRTQAEIAEIVLPDEVDLSASVARSIVQQVIKHDISEVERAEIATHRRQESGASLGAMRQVDPQSGKLVQVGRAALDKKIETGELPADIFKKSGQKGGATRAARIRENGGTFFNITPEQRSNMGREAGTRLRDTQRGIFAPAYTSLEAKQAQANRMLEVMGKTRFSVQEKARLMELVALGGAYIRTEGPRPGTPNYERIRETLIEEGYPDRTPHALRSQVYRLRKKK